MEPVARLRFDNHALDAFGNLLLQEVARAAASEKQCQTYSHNQRRQRRKQSKRRRNIVFAGAELHEADGIQD